MSIVKKSTDIGTYSNRNPSDVRGDSVYAVFGSSQQSVLDENNEIHGLTARDFLEGHSCEICHHYTRNDDEYEQAVLQVHGVKPRDSSK